jgi:Ca2+/Na+ antiporter
MCGEAYTDLNDKTLEALESICYYMLFLVCCYLVLLFSGSNQRHESAATMRESTQYDHSILLQAKSRPLSMTCDEKLNSNTKCPIFSHPCGFYKYLHLPTPLHKVIPSV